MKAYEVIASPNSWTKYVLARNRSGFPVDARGEEACRWCAIGAMCRAYGEGTDEVCVALCKVENALIDKGYGGYISLFNDRPECTHEEVYNLLKGLDV